MNWNKIRLTGYAILGSTFLASTILTLAQDFGMIWPVLLFGTLFTSWFVADIIIATIRGETQRCTKCGGIRNHSSFQMTADCPRCNELEKQKTSEGESVDRSLPDFD